MKLLQHRVVDIDGTTELWPFGNHPGQWYVGMLQHLYVYTFVGQLHITVVIIIFIVIADIMHTEKVCYCQVLIQLMVLLVMDDQGRQLQQLIHRCVVQQKYAQ